MPTLADSPLPGPLRQLNAVESGLVAALESLVERSPQQSGAEPLVTVLDRLDSPEFNLAHGGVSKSFLTMTMAERTRVLSHWRDHSSDRLRDAFQAFKRGGLYRAYVDPGSPDPNPVWESLNYRPMSGPPPSADDDGLHVVESPIDLKADVIVVGSGAGGSVAAAELARQGLSVLLLERGAFWPRGSFGRSEWWSNRHLMAKSAGPLTTNGCPLVLSGNGVGGGTVVNWMTCLEPPPELLEQWGKDWGVDCAANGELLESCRIVAERLQVNSSPADLNAQNAVLQQGCRQLNWSHRPLPRNALGCHSCDLCGFGCRSGHKQDSRRTFLADACRMGARVIPNTTVNRVDWRGPQDVWVETLHRATGKPPVQLTFRGQAVVIAAGAIESPALLLRSGVQHPDLGRHLHLHPTAMTFGRFPQPIRPWQGPPQLIVCEEFTHLSAGGYGVRLETAPLHPGFAALALGWESGEQHKERMSQLEHLANLIILTRDRDGGHISCDRNGRPQVHYQLSAHDAKNLSKGMSRALLCHQAAGADELLVTLHQPLSIPTTDRVTLDRLLGRLDRGETDPRGLDLFSAHQMSTCRMSSSRQTGVTDPEGKVRGMSDVYVADASLFPTATGVNPMLTVMGLARIVARRLAAR